MGKHIELYLHATGSSSEVQQQYVTAMNKDGDQIFITNTTGIPSADPANFIAVELLSRDLQRIRALPGDPVFSVVSAGCASGDFKRFALLDLNPNPTSGSLGEGRLRIFGMESFQQESDELIFPDFLVSSDELNVIQGSFSPDGNLLAVTYPNDSTSNSGVLVLVDVRRNRDIRVVDSQPCPGGSSGAVFFELDGHLYLANAPYGNGSAAPSLQVWRVKDDKLRLVESVPVPAVVIHVSVMTKDGHAYLAITMEYNTSAGAPVLMDPGFVSPALSNTLDQAEFQVYRFSGHFVQLVASQDFLDFGYAVSWHPDKTHLVVARGNGTFNLLLWNSSTPPGAATTTTLPTIFQIWRFEDGQLHLTNQTFAAPGLGLTPAFSGDGKWLYLGGGEGLSTGSDVFNKLVFRVKHAD
ncbi:MAG: WD40 repeat domain-containing protein [Sulfobacillus sp.]